MVRDIFGGRQWGLFAIRVLHIFRISAVLLLHLTKPTLHSLHIVIELWRPVRIMILCVDTVAMRNGPVHGVVVILFPVSVKSH